MPRVFLFVLDSFGVGFEPDAYLYGDEGSNTLLAVSRSPYFHAPNLTECGLFNIDGCVNAGEDTGKIRASYGRLREKSAGKDTTIGHWELCGVVSAKPLPVFPNGFPDEIIKRFENITGKKVLCNKPYSGTEVLKDYGPYATETGDLIVYTSADSVFQVAAHEKSVPISELYGYCRAARELLKGEYGVGRVIARPFVGSKEEGFTRTVNRHDFSITPPSDTLLDVLKANGKDVIGVGKINDIFAGQGLTETVRTKNNADGMRVSGEYIDKAFDGLCFINLVDFDMLYGHRNDADGYAKAISEFDAFFGKFTEKLRAGDAVFVTADHGCDPSTPSTDHSREYVPLLAVGDGIKNGVNIGTRESFADIAATIADIFGINYRLAGASFLNEIADNGIAFCRRI